MAITTIRIHPAIGVARLGNSPEFFIGPEEPGKWSPPPGGTYKDSLCRIKKQAARFRLFAFDQNGTFVKELFANDVDVKKISWTVHLANRKGSSRRADNGIPGVMNAPVPNVDPPAGPIDGNIWRNPLVTDRSSLIIDPGPKTLDGPNQAAAFNTGKFLGAFVPLGEMRTQQDGTLLVLAASGNSGTPIGANLVVFADNSGWYDDVADGPVTATVELTDGTTPPVAPAWVLCVPPKFAPAIQPIITMYDSLLDRWVRDNPNFDPNLSIDSHVAPFYKRLNQTVHVNQDVKSHSFKSTALPAAGSNLAQTLFAFLRDPANPILKAGKMPKLWSTTNERNGTVTALQYKTIKRWAGPNNMNNPALPQSSPALTVWEKLDRANLELCIGGNLYPGIEASWWLVDVFKYTAPFRLDHNAIVGGGKKLQPGMVTQQNSLPWQSDFLACYAYDDGIDGDVYAWWPAARLDEVTRGGLDNQEWIDGIVQTRKDMVERWHKLGFVVPENAGDVDATGKQVEKERFVVCKSCFIVTDRNEFSHDEVDGALTGGSPAKFPLAFYVAVEGFTPAELGIANLNPDLNTVAPKPTFLRNGAPTTQMKAVPTHFLPQDSALPATPQRFTFGYEVQFTGVDDFLKNGVPEELQVLILESKISGQTCQAPVRLLSKQNPYMIDGQVSWLSDDLRVFQVTEGSNAPFAALPNLKLNGNDAAAARQFISNLIDELNKPNAPNVFGGISTDQTASKLEWSASVGGKRVFNFALARVRYRAKALDASGVRVFFRMFTVAATGLEFRPSDTYRTADIGNGPIPLLGKQAGDIVTIPFFAAKRETAKAMDEQQDPKNVQTLKASGDKEFLGYFGCWLDFNQKDEKLFPFHPANDGPFMPNNSLSIQELTKGKHQCLVAEVNYQFDAIPPNASPASSDQLAQRNLLIVESDNPGGGDTHTIEHPFQIGPTRAHAAVFGFTHGAENPLPVISQPADEPRADELMIRWIDLPRDSDMRVYFPTLTADDILEQATGRYDVIGIERVDDHTIRCRPAEVTWIPLPPRDRTIPALLHIELPDDVRTRQVFRVVVHQVSGLDRAITGAYQLTIPVSSAKALIGSETRLLAVLRHVLAAVPIESPWYPVMTRYEQYVAKRVRGYGGIPELVRPSADGGEGKDEWEGKHSFLGKLSAFIERILYKCFKKCPLCPVLGERCPCRGIRP